MDSTKQHIEEQRILSFCYGYGGLDKGISRVIATRTVAYVEIESFQNFNLVTAMEAGMVDKAPIWTDLKTFEAKPFRDRVHGIIGGYPCQGESLAGKRKLWEDRRFLWPYIERSIIDARPFWCFFENVSGHLTGSFPYILESLRSMGYKVEAGIFTASEVGAPHKRERVFILAMDDSTNNRLWKWQIPKIKGGESRSQKRWQLENGFEGSNIEMVDSNSERWYRDRLSSGSKEEFSRPTMSSESIPNSSSERNRESSQEHKAGFFKQESHKWPAGPGQKQFEWEEPRTIKPGLGCTVNGYNFRTELLRQYGNGVVSETAEKAFIYLLEKHQQNLSRVKLL